MKGMSPNKVVIASASADDKTACAEEYSGCPGCPYLFVRFIAEGGQSLPEDRRVPVFRSKLAKECLP